MTARPDQPDLLISILAVMPGLAERLLAEHVDDGTRHCRACPLGGQAGFHVWPCSIRDLAERAHALEIAGRSTHPRAL
jgi:hypothetical protein